MRKNGEMIRVQSFDTNMEMRQYASGMLDAIIQAGVRTVQDAIKQAWTWQLWGDVYHLELSPGVNNEAVVPVWKVEWSGGWWAIVMYVGAETQSAAVRYAQEHALAEKSTPNVTETQMTAREYGVLSVDEFSD